MKRIVNKIKKMYVDSNIAVRASLWFAVCSILQKGISVITMPIFTRLMETSQYGEYSIFQTWYNIFILIVTLNIQSEIFNKGLIEHSDEKNKFTANQTGLLIVLTGTFTAIYLLLHGLINKLLGLSTFLVFIMICEIFANAIISLWLSRKRFDFEYRKIVFLTLSTSILNPIVGVVAVYLSKNKAEARIVSNAIIPIVVAAILMFVIVRYGKLFGNTEWWKKAIIGSLPLLPHYLSLVLLNQSDKLMINHFDGAEDAAIYSVAHSAGLLMTIINTSINGSYVPWIYEKLKAKVTNGVDSVSNSLCMIVMICNVMLIWFAPEAISLLAAPQYAEATYCLVPIATSVFFFFVYTLIVDVEIYYGKNQYVAIASVCAAILNITLNYIFIPFFGYLAAGYTTLISYIVTMLLHFMFLKKTLIENKSSLKLFDRKGIVCQIICLLGMTVLAVALYDLFAARCAIFIVGCIVIIINRHRIVDAIAEIKKEKAE